ncbi:TonB-dependent receptor [Fulvivirga lutimaris]|uniref:TonB-dependent receptor n=1 Tax=Fulvivirga lutimaris TaxID=1819566 RepID=UPI0012BB6767|nr:TonB-dependent receptor [Fulvivirga lutimaris]MTI39730.1 TonB-dependent receptor [Fulvivirga lutimaris]
MKHLFSTLLFLIVSTLVMGQQDCRVNCSCSIKGKIVDAQTGKAIEFASLQIKGTSKGSTTDSDGLFEFNDLCETEVDLLISHIGYKQLTHHHDAFHNDPVVQLAPDNLILESIVVEDKAEKDLSKSSSISTIEGREFEEIKSESLGDALSSISGVSTLTTGSNVVKPIIHGLHSNRILIINNGIRHESQDWGQEHAPEIDASMAEGIELIKGAAAVKYGPNAIGGVILINPPKMELSSHFHGDINLQAESNGRALDGSFLFQKGFENFAWMVQGAGRYQGDLNTPDYQLTNTGLRESSLGVGLRFHKRQWDFETHFSHFEQKLGILRGSITGNIEDLADAINDEIPDFTEDFSYEIKAPNQEVSHDVLKLKASHNFTNSRLDLTYAIQYNTRKEFDVRRGSNADVPSINLELMTHTVDAEWLHPTVNDWEGTLGIQWLYQDNNNVEGTNTIPFIPNYNNGRIGVYIAETRSLSTNTTLDIGLRYDFQNASFRGRDSRNDIFIVDENFQSVSGIIGIKKTLNSNSEMRMNLATAWRPPNIAELFSYGKHQYTNQYGFYRYTNENGNITTDVVLDSDDLSVGNELGYKLIGTYSYANSKIILEVSPYLNVIKNYIYSAPSGIINTVRGTFPLFVFKQTDALLSGLDATLKIKHSEPISSKITGSYLYARDIKNDDVLFNMPANKISYQINFTKSLGNVEWDNKLEVSYNFEQYNAPRVIPAQTFVDDRNFNPFATDDSNFDFTKAPEGYTLVNASSTLSFKQWVVSLRGKNLFNTTYRQYTNLIRYFADEPGINFELGVQLKL